MGRRRRLVAPRACGRTSVGSGGHIEVPKLGSVDLKATRQLCEIPCRNLRASALKEHAAWQGT